MKCRISYPKNPIKLTNVDTGRSQTVYPPGFQIKTGFGRVIATCLGGRKWNIHVDGQLNFTTSRGMTGVQARLEWEVDRIDGPLHNEDCTCSSCRN